MNNMFKSCLFLCLFSSVSSFCETPANIVVRALDNGIADGVGIAGTFDSMWGFAYRRHFPDNIGFVVNLGGAFADRDSRVGASAGALFTLFHHHFPSLGFKESSVRVLAGVTGLGAYARDVRPEVATNARDSFIFGASFGPGIEYFLNRNFAFNLEMPWLTKFRAREGKVQFDGSAPTLSAGFTYYI